MQIGPGVSWEALDRESHLAERTPELTLSLGRVEEFGRFPDEPYSVEVRADGLYRNAKDLNEHSHLETTEAEQILLGARAQGFRVAERLLESFLARLQELPGRVHVDAPQ